ncbi:MAG: hypothetical protein ACRC8S_01900 [Fimbriiglobus sp.]
MILSRMGHRPLAAVVLAIGVAGCETSPNASTADTRIVETASIHPKPDAATVQGTRQEVQRPDLTRLEYDSARRVLKVYTLENRAARWMLTFPGAPMGTAVMNEYAFPETCDLDLDQVTLFYTTPNHRASASVTLREIIECGTINALR